MEQNWIYWLRNVIAMQLLQNTEREKKKRGKETRAENEGRPCPDNCVQARKPCANLSKVIKVRHNGRSSLLKGLLMRDLSKGNLNSYRRNRRFSWLELRLSFLLTLLNQFFLAWNIVFQRDDLYEGNFIKENSQQLFI